MKKKRQKEQRRRVDIEGALKAGSAVFWSDGGTTYAVLEGRNGYYHVGICQATEKKTVKRLHLGRPQLPGRIKPLLGMGKVFFEHVETVSYSLPRNLRVFIAFQRAAFARDQQVPNFDHKRRTGDYFSCVGIMGLPRQHRKLAWMLERVALKNQRVRVAKLSDVASPILNA
jgi:hypothetical protein